MKTSFDVCLINVILFSSLITKKIDAAANTNIVLIVADDLGWNDVSFHGSDQILTPNIDTLANSGVVLNRYYSHCVCTPSRSALLTGKYAYTIGMQGYPLTNAEDRAVPLTEKLLPEYLKDLGYSTHLVGKWHIGHSRTEYLPTSRGFDTHFGHRTGFVDYYEYISEENWTGGKVSGFDMYRNLNAAWDAEGYLTDLYTDEARKIIQLHNASSPLFLMVSHAAPHSGNDGAVLQAPPDLVRKMRYVESPERRILAAMIKKLDDSVGDIMEALLQKEILQNTIVIFISDNGGMTTGDSVNYASNWPLRGEKMSPFEGGLRVVGLLWSSQLEKVSNHRWDGYMHVSDWLPTILAAAGGEQVPNLDGINQWENIKLNKNSDRDKIFEINEDWGFMSVIKGDYKLVSGKVIRNYSKHLGGDLQGIIGNPPDYMNEITKCKSYNVLKNYGNALDVESVQSLRNGLKLNCPEDNVEICYPNKNRPCLFNIKEDPCERKDLFTILPDVTRKLQSCLHKEIPRMILRPTMFRNPKGAPSLNNYTWTTFANSFSLVKLVSDY